MANYITTLKDDNGTNNLLPKTVLKAVADDNGNYLDNGLAASDINKLKGGEIVKLEENLARIETSPTTHAYSVGERLVYNGILYRVKAAISVGDDLVVNTNIEKKSVDDALSDIMAESNNSIKFRDGTMLYWNSDTFSPTQVGFNNISTPSLPSDFVSTSSYFVSCYQENIAGVYVSNTSRNNNVLDLYFYCPSASYTVHYTYLVIGRWK